MKSKKGSERQGPHTETWGQKERKEEFSERTWGMGGHKALTINPPHSEQGENLMEEKL